MLNFGLDWDGTYTADPSFFMWLAREMQKAGHKVYIVTMRYPSESSELSEMRAHVDGVVFTSREAKRAACGALGLKIHIWLDDNPEAIAASAVSIWGTCTPQNTIIVPDPATGALNERKVTPEEPWDHPWAEQEFLAVDVSPPHGYWVHFKRSETSPWELGYTRLLTKNHRSTVVVSVTACDQSQEYREDYLDAAKARLGHFYSWKILAEPRKP